MNFVELSQVAESMHGSDWLQTFSCSSKAKINGLIERTFGEQDLLVNTQRLL